MRARYNTRLACAMCDVRPNEDIDVDMRAPSSSVFRHTDHAAAMHGLDRAVSVAQDSCKMVGRVTGLLSPSGVALRPFKPRAGVCPVCGCVTCVPCPLSVLGGGWCVA